MSFGERLRRTREAKNLTVHQLADETGLNAATTSILERKPRDPKASSLMKLAGALEVSIGFLMSEENQDLDLPVALRRQALQRFLATSPASEEQKKHFEQLCFLDSA